MAFKLKKELKPKYKNKFVIKAKWMHGDADGYSTIETLFSKSKTKAAEEFVEVLESLCDVVGDDLDDELLFEQVKDKSYLLKEIESYHDKCRVQKINEEEYEDQIKDVVLDFFEIPSDSTTDGQFLASFVSVEVLFYDEKGKVIDVEVK